MKYRDLIEGKHRQVCPFCYGWTPTFRRTQHGIAAFDRRQYICGKGSKEEHYIELIDEPCLIEDWLVCPLNTARQGDEVKHGA